MSMSVEYETTTAGRENADAAKGILGKHRRGPRRTAAWRTSMHPSPSTRCWPTSLANSPTCASSSQENER